MASKSEDVYIRVHLDANNAEGELMSLEEAMEKLKKRKDELDALVAANKLTTNDEEYQYIARKFEVVRRLAAETRQSVIKVEEVVSHLTEATTKEIKAAMTKAQRTISTLTRTGEDAQKLALTQEQFIALKGELDRRNAASEPLQRRLKDITKLTADELDRCVKESGKMVKTLEQGTPEALKMFSTYKRFREEQEYMNGQMSYAQAGRLAMGRDKGTLSQITEASKYLKEYKAEWGQFMGTTMGRELDERIQNITKRQLEMARSIANGSVKASYEDMKTALQIIKQRWEALDPNVKKNQSLIHDLGLEYEKLKANINAWGSATMTKGDAANVMAQSLILLKKGVDADANAVAYYIDQLELAENAEGMSIANQHKRIEVLKQMQDLYRGTGKAMLDASKVESNADRLIASGSDSADAGEIAQTIKDLRTLKTQYGETSAAAQRYDAKIKQLEAKLRSASAASREMYDGNFVAKTIKNINTAPVEDLEKAMLMCRNRMRDAQTSLTDYIKTAVQLKQMQRQVRGVTDEFKAQSDWLTTNVKKIGNYLGVFGGFYLVRQQFEQWFRASMKYDDQLVDIQKTTNMTTQAIHELADGIKRIDSRSSVESLQSLAYTAGKLGVKSVSEVMGFVRAADMLNVSLGEQLGDDAAERLMKVATVMGTTDAYGLEDALMRTGSAITELAKNSAASADPIVAFMSRTAGLAKQSGITTAELAGLGAAVSALGQPVEMSATSFSKMMVQMEKSYKTVGKALKMTDQEMETMRLNLETGNGMDAFLDMLKRVKEMGGLSNTASIAKDLGSEGNRVIQTLSTLASSYDTIERMVRQSTEAFEENTTVLEEYRKKNNNTAALFERIKNAFAKMFVSTDNVEWLNQILVKLQVLPDAVKQLIDNFRDMGSLFGGFVVDHIYGLVNALSALFKVMMWKAALNGVVNLTMHTRSAIVAFWSYVAAAKAADVATKTFTFSIKALQAAINPVFAVIGVVTTLWQVFANNEKEATKWNESLNDSLDRTQRTAADTTYEMEKLLNKIKEAEDAGNDAIASRQRLGELFKGYIGELDVEKERYESLAKAIRAANSELRAKQLYEATNQHVRELEDKAAQAQTPEYDAMVASVRTRINSGDAGIDEQIAVRAVNAMIADPKKFGMYLDLKKDGKTYEANSDWTFSDRKKEIQANINAAITQAVKDSGFEGVTPNLLTAQFAAQGDSKHVFNTLTESFENLANSANGWRESIEKAQIEGYGRAAVEARAANDVLEGRMDSEWAKFANAINRGGAFDAVNQTMKQRSGKNKNDATADDWARDIRNLDKTKEGQELRNQYQRSVAFWLEDARNKYTNLDIQRGAIKNNKAEQDKITAQMKQLDIQIKNAEKFADVVALPVKEAVDPNADEQARRDAKQEMDNLIQKIKTFYEIQANAYKEMRQQQQITETEYQRSLEQNNRDMSASLADAYAALSQDADMTEERYKQITERMRQENKRSGAGEIGDTQIGIVSDTSYASVQNINKQLSGDKENGTAWTNSMRRKRREEEGNVIESLNKEMQARIKAWLEQNPAGKVAKEFQKQFEEMGLLIDIKPEFNLDGSVIRNLDQVQNDLMKQMLEIGKHVSEYDVTTEKGRKVFADYVKDLQKFPDVAHTAVLETSTDISTFYYKVYEYAEQYEEQMKRLTDRTMRMWKKMYDAGDAHQSIQKQLTDLERLQKRFTELEKFGLHERFNQDAEVRKATLEYNDALASFEEKVARARAHMASAKALEVGGKTEDGTDITAQYRDAEIASAQAELDAMKAEGDQVVEIYGKVIDAQAAVREATYSWVADMKDAFEQFMDGFVPFRSWYEDNGSFAENVFGTTEERQKAFGQFMDDLKKTVREALMEQAKLWFSKKIHLDDKASEVAQDKVNPAKDAVDKTLGRGNKTDDNLSPNEALRARLEEENQIKYEEHIKEEEEALRHKQRMDEINGVSGDGEQMDEQTKLDLKKKGFQDELSIEQLQQDTQLAMKQQAEESLEELTRKSVNKLFRIKQKGAKDEFKVAKVSAEDRAKVEEKANTEVGETSEDLFDVQSQLAKAAKNIRINNSQEATKQEEADNVESAGVSMWGSFGEAVAKAWAQGGPYLGPVLAAVVSAAVGGLITMVMNMMGASSKSANIASAKTKLVSGMLTYDGGNVQSFSGVRTYNNGTGAQRRTINMLPVMGDDGRVYMVPEGDLMGQNNMSEFTGMVTRPTLTTVGGAPALVGERGPEMVIGRETTSAMMMSRPDLIRQIVEFDRNRSRGFAKTFDSGNVGDAAAELGMRSEELGVDGSAARGMTEETALALTSAITMLSDQLSHPIRAEFNMNGKGGAADQMAQGLLNSRRLGDLDSVKRLFGNR